MKASKEVKLKAQLPGEVVYLAGEEGDEFDQDTVLAAVDDSQLLAKRKQVVSQIRQAQTALRNANVQYSREVWSPRAESPNRMPGMGMPSIMDQMFTRQAGDALGIGDPDVERRANLFKSGTQVRQARSKLQQARASLEEIDAKLRDTRAYAPFEGIITNKMVEVGDTVQPGVPLLHFADTNDLQLEVGVPVGLVSSLRKDQTLPVRLAMGEHRTQGTVAQIFPVANQRKHTVTVKLDLPQGTPGGPGMYGEVSVPADLAQNLRNTVVPYNAVVWRGSMPNVFVVDESGKASLRMIRLGEAVGNDRVAVLSGLQEGEQVLVNPPSGIKSGYQVGQGNG
ncbi:efflux RND transporter periplasmic adaptor subunit [Thiohalorhabdus sp.]|uniref:efflux RND transporter periplasmic adaptor subunit n=1 Tax=Thiohalorhabdus sp. TaxID=3094134 RepID=UPI002FC276C3